MKNDNKEEKDSFADSKNDMGKVKCICFDWAAKRMLRDKANFEVLEGLLTVLLNEEVSIVDMLESESNQNSESDKYNRVDVLAKSKEQGLFIVEVQQRREGDYLERALFGVAKTLTEHISKGEHYWGIKKVYSINILYFDIGSGDDFVYRGQTEFKGLNSHDVFEITEKERNNLDMKSVQEVFPEYYIIRVNSFNKKPETHLEEWVNYLKCGEIDEDTTAPGLAIARKRWNFLQMSEKEQNDYFWYYDTLVRDEDVLRTSIKEGFADGKEEGLKEGLQQGIEQGLQQGIEQGKQKAMESVAMSLHAQGMDKDAIYKITGVVLQDNDS